MPLYPTLPVRRCACRCHRRGLGRLSQLGLGGRAQNGFTFWGLSTSPRRAGDPIATLVKVWERYQGRATALVSTAVNDENRARFRDVFEKHAGELAELAKAV